MLSPKTTTREIIHKLGPPLAVFRSPGVTRRHLLVYTLFGGVFVLAPLAYGWYRGTLAGQLFGPAARNTWSRPWYATALLGLVVLFILVALRLRLGQRLVAVHKRGVLISLSRPRPLLWHEIAGICLDHHQINVGSWTVAERCSAWLHPQTDRPVRIPASIPRIPVMVSLVKEHLYPRLAPGLQTAWSAGQWLHFGPISLNRQTLRLPQRQVLWQAVKAIDIRQGYLVVELHTQEQFRVPVARVPNIELFLQVIHRGPGASSPGLPKPDRTPGERHP